MFLCRAEEDEGRPSQWVRLAKMAEESGVDAAADGVSFADLPGGAAEERGDTEFAFVGCSVALRARKRAPARSLLDNVSASVRGGRTLAILGPSGAGKTTLLNLLTLEPMMARGSVSTGVVTLDGEPLSEAGDATRAVLTYARPVVR